MKPVYILNAKRSPVVPMGDIFRDLKPEYLAAAAIQQTFRDIPNFNIGNVNNVSLASETYLGPLARLSGIMAGIPEIFVGNDFKAGVGGGMTAIIDAFWKIQNNVHGLCIAGGVEVCSKAPHVTDGIRWGSPTRGIGIEDSLQILACDKTVGKMYANIAEMVHGKYKLSQQGYENKTIEIPAWLQCTRAAQDEWATFSRQRALEAVKADSLKTQLIEIPIIQSDRPDIQPKITIKNDIGTFDLTLEEITAFPPLPGGTTITVANQAHYSDGAAILVLADDNYMGQITDCKPMAEILGAMEFANHPLFNSVAMARCAYRLIQTLNIPLEQITVWQISETFAAYVLGVIAEIKELSMGHLIPNEKINPQGGSIAYGNPIAASSAIQVVQLVNILHEGEIGIAVSETHNGQAVAIVIKRLQIYSII